MKAKLSLAMGVALLAGCVQVPPAPSINANGAIRWANGITEDMHISASGSTLTFAAPQSLFNPGGITIFSRIDSARNGACEHYYSEQALKTRMNICDSGEVTLLVEGQVINVGSLAKFVY
ncbi:hypothetical protein [Photobacterium gaetbulicola]|uniref:hypothetical protein n=1 Tax=Photobacterium gaetbulicola TaxID=1295392 RepID=UPI000AEDA496|nr:hypothetical protein [Photobacterium gaetbulicola]